ncbi:hypothetical protein [uncultured Holdemanella sp.]|uniref:hypothetical protein n=1 Tax=uncultured Holdemanella sp. TaxID=1763549 RepID=UPI0025CF0910|nr:hypothetical protein [uncultured Holdemanella sp.]
MNNNNFIHLSRFIFTQEKLNTYYVYVQVDLVQNEFCVQACKKEMVKHPTFDKESEFHLSNGSVWKFDVPATRLKNGKNNFQPTLTALEDKEKCIFSYGAKLTEKDRAAIMPYCNALKFKKYLDGKVKMKDNWYRDEYTMYFDAVTDSHIPYMHFDMSFIDASWPTEKLRKVVYNRLIRSNKELMKYMIC